MSKQATVPTGIAFLKGFSILDPSEAFMTEMRQVYWSHLDSFEPDESVLWVGAPDFRLFFVSFGSAQATLYFFVPFFTMIVAPFIDDSIHHPNKAYVYIACVVLMIGTLFLQLAISLNYIGITYAITNKRIFILYAKRLHLLVWQRPFRSIALENKCIFYYDVGYILRLRCIQMIGGDLGTIFFDESVNDIGSITFIPKLYKEQTTKLKMPLLQQFRYNHSPFNRIAAIHNSDRVMELINESRKLRINNSNKLHSTKIIYHG